jgi:hypothetical protein
MSNYSRASYVKVNNQVNGQYPPYENILGSYATSGRLAKLTREVDYNYYPLGMNKLHRPQVSNLYQYYTHLPGLVQGKYSYFTLDNAYGRP